MFGLAVTTCLVITLAGYGTQAAQNVAVVVYYESYCPDSIKFETQQLYPLMQNTNFSINVDLKLVPYGKASYLGTEGNYTFTCHHGEKECYGNKVQACAIKYITSRKEQLDFINCVMSEVLANKSLYDNSYPTRKCGDHIQDIGKVESCGDGREGSDLLLEYGKQTEALSPPLKSVPTVVVNNDRADSNINLKAMVCKHLAALNLTECAGTSGSSQPIAGFFSLLLPALILIFVASA